MLRTTDTHEEFESLARAYLEQHPEIPHAWRKVHDASGGRMDLVCWPDTSKEVFASLTNYQITVGENGVDTDYEDFGRGLSERKLAQEAFDHFVKLLCTHG